MTWLRRLFCKHAWRVLARTVVKPRQTFIQNGPIHILPALFEAEEGRTEFLVTCDQCGALQCHKLAGVETPA